MSSIIGQNQASVWYQKDGKGTEMVFLGVGENQGGMTGKGIPGPGSTPVYGRDRSGNPVVIRKNKEAPGGLPTATVSVHEKATIDFLWDTFIRGCGLNIQERLVECGTIDNPNKWDKMRHWSNGDVNNYTPSDGPNLTFDDTEMQIDAEITFDHVIQLVKTQLTSLTTTELGAILSIAGLSEEDCNECGTGYPGADEILYMGAAPDPASVAGTSANVLVSTNGGGTISSTSADPFANGEDVTFIAARLIDDDTIRVVVGTGTTDAAADAKFAYADVTLGSETTTTWTSVTIAATANGDVIEALGWLLFGRLYIASAGDIFVSTDQGGSDPGTAVYTGSTTINGFSKSQDDRFVYAFGASNLILREKNQNDVFETMVGPAGGGAFTALTVAGDGLIYAGNGQSIYKNTDGANAAGNWTSLKDFGSNHVVKSIQCIGGARAGGGDSQLIRVVVDDTTPGTAEVWESMDGGNSFQQVQELTNTGYNDAYFSTVDDNLAIVVGDVSGGLGVIQKLSPKA